MKQVWDSVLYNYSSLARQLPVIWNLILLRDARMTGIHVPWTNISPWPIFQLSRPNISDCEDALTMIIKFMSELPWLSFELFKAFIHHFMPSPNEAKKIDVFMVFSRWLDRFRIAILAIRTIEFVWLRRFLRPLLDIWVCEDFPVG